MFVKGKLRKEKLTSKGGPFELKTPADGKTEKKGKRRDSFKSVISGRKKDQKPLINKTLQGKTLFKIFLIFYVLKHRK